MGEDDCCGEVVELLSSRLVDWFREEGFEVGLYVAVEALVCALLGGKGEGGGTGGQAEDVVEGLHGGETWLIVMVLVVVK